MNKIITGLMGLAVVAIALVGCSPSVQEQCANSKNPQECLAYTNAGGGINDYLMYGMMGYMLGRSGNQTVVIRDPNYHGYVPQRRTPLPSTTVQVARLQAKVANQKMQLQRSQAANARYKSQLSSYSGKGSATNYRSYTPSSTYRSYGASYRPSYSSYRSSYSSSSFRSSSFSGRR